MLAVHINAKYLDAMEREISMQRDHALAAMPLLIKARKAAIHGVRIRAAVAFVA